MATFTATALQNEPLDALVWRVMGTASPVVEQVLDLNPGIADTLVLAEGQVVTLPLILAPATPQLDIVQLWT